MPHVLLVDDDAVQASVYSQLLTRRGFTCERRADVASAERSLATRVPDAVVLDLGLPDLGGVELIRAVRDHPLGRGVKIFVLANAFLELEALAAWEAGADQVVGKAIYPPEQVIEFLAAEVGGLDPQAHAADETDDPALAEFLERAAGYVQSSRDGLAHAAASGASDGALADLAVAMRRLQAAQAFGLPTIPQVAAITEWLARALLAWPSSVGPSSLRTLTQALDVIQRRIGEPRGPVTDFANCRVLGVDDDATSRLLLQQAFRKIKVPCDLATSGAAALRSAELTAYDLVVTDVMMPGMDGFGLVAALRALPSHRTTPVIYVTALDGFDHTFEHDPHGGTDAIVKPYLIMELATKAVVHLLRGRS